MGQLASRLRAPVSQRARAVAIGIGACLFLVTSYFAFTGLPDDVEFHWAPVVLLAVVTAPLTLVLNAGEYVRIADLGGSRISLREAFPVTLLASLANFLPAPGGVAVRVGALVRDGSSVRRAVGANGVAGGIWIATASILAGVFLLGRATAYAGGVALAGILAIGVLWWYATRALTVTRGSLAGLAAIEAATVLLSGIRVYLAFAALGLEIALVDAILIGTSQVIAAAIGVIPAGLGLRELLSGLIASRLDIPVASAIAATSVDRVASQIGFGLLVLILLARHQISREQIRRRFSS